MEPDDAELLNIDTLSLAETAAPPVPSDELHAMNQVWDQATRANPLLFDGPAAVCTGMSWEGRRSLRVFWARTTYRQHALRFVPGATAWLPSFFVCAVQLTDHGGVLVGQMSSSTAAPGQWQLPGGTVEPPIEGEVLDEAALHGHAARELAEETGIVSPPDALRLELVLRRVGSIGVLFLAPSLPEELLLERFAALAAYEEQPEFDRIAFIRTVEDLDKLDGPHVDYLKPVVERHQARAWRHLAKRA